MLSRSGFEDIPGSLDRTGRGVIEFYWRRREAAAREYSVAGSAFANINRAIKALEAHCKKHPRDWKSADRYSKLCADRVGREVNLVQARFSFRLAGEEFEAKMFELAGLPRSYWQGAKVTFLDRSGSIEIRFGSKPDRGRWLLYANGVCDQRVTPRNILA